MIRDFQNYVRTHIVLITPVLMVGGAGTRLWPMSLKERPKQFQALITSKTMFQETVLRITGKLGEIEFGAPVIIGASAYHDLITEQLAEIGVAPARIILEPSAQNTAAVAAVAAKCVEEINGGLVLLLPSDSHMEDADAFRDAVEKAAKVAADDWITTFGIPPDRPETGYGYIKAGDFLENGGRIVDAFVEKPDLETAEAYLASENYSWNAGLFIFRPQTMLDEMQLLAPKILGAALDALKLAKSDGTTCWLDPIAFAKCEKLSIDYAVMEKTSKAALLGPVECGWNDVGSWQALKDIAPSLQQDNIVTHDVDNCYIRTDKDILITAIGISDMIIVAHENAILIMPQDRSQDVKKIVEALKDKDLEERL